METDPIAIDLDVDAALLLRHTVGIDSDTPVYRLGDRERVDAVVA
ncbi:hypothetical protein [Nocardia amamiensis]|nr:hypothetical protein [Nocardia amamiensis]